MSSPDGATSRGVQYAKYSKCRGAIEQDAHPNKGTGLEMKIVVLGAGLMGRAVVYDLSGAREVKSIVVADFDRGRAQDVARKFGRGISRAAFADVRDTSHLAKLLHGCDVVLN